MGAALCSLRINILTSGIKALTEVRLALMEQGEQLDIKGTVAIANPQACILSSPGIAKGGSCKALAGTGLALAGLAAGPVCS